MAELVAGDGMNTSAYSRYRFIVVTGLIAISIVLEIVVHGIFGIEVVYTHFFYLPIALGAIWYGIRGIAVAAGLAGFYLLSGYVISGSFASADIIRSGMFLAVGIVIAIIAEFFSRQEKKLLNEVADACLRARPGRMTAVLDNLDEMRNRILSYANVSHLRDEKNVPGLIRALHHPEVAVQYEAVEALGDLKDTSAIEPLIEVLSKDEYSAVRWKAAEALVKIGPPAVGDLIEVLSNPDEDVRWKAAIALGEIGDARAIDPLIRLLGDDDRFVKGRAAYALGKIGRPAVAALSRALEEGEPGTRWGAAIALGQIKDPASAPPLAKALLDRSDSVRVEAASALSGMGSTAVAVLIGCMERSGNEGLWRIVSAIWEPSGLEESPLLRLFLESPPDLRERAAAVAERSGESGLLQFAALLRQTTRPPDHGGPGTNTPGG
jgi:HEAT repeat protein